MVSSPLFQAQGKDEDLGHMKAVKEWAIFTGVDDVIEGDYKTGPALIYDCKRRAWMCVDLESFSRCRKEREDSLKQPGALFPCAPIGEARDIGQCVQLQYLNIHLWQWKIFCLKRAFE